MAAKPTEKPPQPKGSNTPAEESAPQAEEKPARKRKGRKESNA